jgi:ATP adenylyltransferase
MEQLFAPWRMEWVEREDGGESIEGCPFCVLPEQDTDRENRIVARSEHSFVLQNNFPYNPGHVMVIPRQHTGDWRDLNDAELLDHARLKARTLDALGAAMDPDGFNAGENLGGIASGGSIDDHLHTHVVPRWTGDTNFMPVVSDTKVVVEGMEASYEKLHEAFAGMDGATVPDEKSAVQF